MRYVSTRGGAAPASFSDVLLTGLAPDGGLYVPQEWPAFTPAEIAAFAGRPYAEVAAEVTRPGATERRDNPRAGSAKLRWARRA